MNIYQPYFYVIYFPTLDKRYAGIRFAQGCHPEELLVKYKTSSKVVHQLLKEGCAPVIEEIIIFHDVNALRDFEVVFLRPKITDNHWLNKGAGKAIFNDLETRNIIGSRFKGRKLTSEHREAISRGGKGLIRSIETRERISKARKGVPNPLAALRMRGKPRSEECRRKISETKRGRPLNDAQRDAIIKAAEANRGRKVSNELRMQLSELSMARWARVREQKYSGMDLNMIRYDLKSGIAKKDIYEKYGISRHCFKHNVEPLL